MKCREKKYHDKAYLDLVRYIVENGTEKQDRTGTGTLSTFAYQMRFDLSGMSIPLLTTKQMHLRSIVNELLWYLRGDTNIKYLKERNVTIWDEWADSNGELGPVYGYQWRKWPKYKDARIDYLADPPCPVVEWDHVDQVADVINRLRTNPTDRRMIISAWNVSQLDEMALPPCHAFFQVWSDGEGTLKSHLYQRSCDVGLGVPFNIAQYSIFTHMLAHVANHEATEFVWTGGDVHIYKNHLNSLKYQLLREPYPSPTITLNAAVKEIDQFTYNDIVVSEYASHDRIKMDVSV